MVYLPWRGCPPGQHAGQRSQQGESHGMSESPARQSKIADTGQFAPYEDGPEFTDEWQVWVVRTLSDGSGNHPGALVAIIKDTVTAEEPGEITVTEGVDARTADENVSVKEFILSRILD